MITPAARALVPGHGNKMVLYSDGEYPNVIMYTFDKPSRCLLHLSCAVAGSCGYKQWTVGKSARN